MNRFLSTAKRVIEIEQQGLDRLASRLDHRFVQACELVTACAGKVVLTGVGKSGHIGHKIAATLASTGTPSFYMHPTEAQHGDLGMLSQTDVVIAISNSGETAELLGLLAPIKRMAIPLIAVTANANSTLAQYSTVSLDISVDQEACSLGLAPTTSTTVTLVLGDALAVALLEAKGFTADDFAFSHPAGKLGRKLLLTAEDVMVKDADVPLVSEQQTVKEAILEITAKGLGMTGVINEAGELIGIFTDGDLRRLLDSNAHQLEQSMANSMTVGCVMAQPTMLATEIVSLMQSKKINSLFVTDANNKPLGALNMHLLLQSGVV